MPFYRINGLMVHMRGTKLPPACVAKLGIGGENKTLLYCLAMSGFYCDFPDGGGHTCDRPLCAAHAYQVSENRHYCPDHFAESTNGQQRSLFTSLVQS